MSSLFGTHSNVLRALLLCLKCMSLKGLGGMALAVTLETILMVSGRSSVSLGETSTTKGKGIAKPKNNNNNKTCFKCCCSDHLAKKFKTPQHLVDLYKKTTSNGQKAQGMKYEAHFVTHEHETGTSAPGSNGAGRSETEIPH